ncbi:hypothetical protein Tsubulata_005128 [Turnera subulata]|uniref:DUF7804 domain-containing protein n=1 Tax=Turnera subulata TaxID=218843 RepID=A0A9Q0JDK2_9ROSI|nr:hypothetical protein Tsubulata_005128 [Turnera subulata]
MASVGIRCGAGGFLDCGLISKNRENNGFVGFSSGGGEDGGALLNLGDFGRFCRRGRMAVVARAAAAVAKREMVVKEEEGKATEAGAVVYERMDQWMRDSVGDIVKNLKEAPLLVQVYSNGEDQGRRPKLETERAVEEEDWPAMIERWQKREARLPEGVIFVERLEEDNVAGGEDDVTRAWGIVVQGRGVDCGPICYLLKTSSGGAAGGGGGGLGLGCTHFCLMRVKSFGETARSQLKNCWLLQGL